MKRKDRGIRDLTPAPGDLARVQAFLNTLDVEAGSDRLSSPRALTDWLVQQSLLGPGDELDDADWRRAIAVRDGWRSLLAGRASEQDVEALDLATASARLRVRHEASDAAWRLEPATTGLDGAIGRLVAILVNAQVEGSWQRVKLCASPKCQAVYYDRSSNRSGRWCRPRCGNRFSSKASKRRRRAYYRQAFGGRSYL